MPKLAYVVTEDWYFLSHRLPLAQQALEAGFDVVVITRVGQYGESIRKAGIRVIPFSMNRSGMNPFREFLSAMKLSFVLRKEGPDIVHLVALKPVVLGNLATRLAGIRSRVSAVAGMGFLFTDSGRGGLLMHLLRGAMGRLLRGSTVIAQNPDDAQLLEKLGVPSRDIRLVEGVGVDLERFKPQPEPPGKPVVMLASRLLRDKGVGEFVEAAAMLRERGHSARFVLVGDADPSNPTTVSRKELDQWQDEGLVECWAHQEHMQDILAAAHVVCLPSYREGLPKVLLEAMACGRPVVATDVPGCREVVTEGQNGLLVPPRDAVALADAISRFLEEVSLRKAFGREGRKLAEQRFSDRTLAAKTLEIYRQVLADD